MTSLLSIIFALLAGAALAAQAATNARLGVLLQNPLAATTCAFFTSLVVSCISLALMPRSLPSVVLAREVPIWLWFTGGTLSFLGVTTIYWLIPKVGVGEVVTLVVVGQIVLSTIASHRGWFHLPVHPIGPMKLIGLGCLSTGVILMQGAQR